MNAVPHVERLDAQVEDLARWASRAPSEGEPARQAIVFLDGNDGSAAGRFSFLGVRPIETRLVRDEDEQPLALFDTLESERDREVSERDLLPGLPLASLPRWIGALGYDLAWACTKELGLRRPRRHPRDERPLAFFHRFEALVIGDREHSAVWLVGDDASAVARLRADLDALERAGAARAEVTPSRTWVEPRGVHARSIEHALGLVKDGLVYQINLARRWSSPIGGHRPGRAVADAMRRASPVPYGALLELVDQGRELAIVSRSMERFLRWDRASGLLETRPIKGTIARTPSTDDAALAASLRADPKEHAEHAMIVDLMRNDLGRVAEVGSVEVHRSFEVEPYAHLHHLVSTVRARSREGATLRDVLLATFPPGSVTGTPKLSAIEHIEGLERHARGFYCGAIGWIDRSGGLSLSVAIRTAQIVGASLDYFAGGGLVIASDVTREIAETELKARVLDEALAALATR
ncbi:MAG: anthranilate synthase component I family protein [Deltaproteobacteria bacterium]|nr:anthranilate synthase component I family protein [Deltaproteobacteria bacterium]